MSIVKCTFTSVWNDGAIIVTDCGFDNETGAVSPKTVDVDPDGALEQEYITLEDGEEVEVCPKCHAYILKTVVGERADLSYGEYKVCSDSNCSGGN